MLGIYNSGLSDLLLSKAYGVWREGLYVRCANRQVIAWVLCFRFLPNPRALWPFLLVSR
jgi:hypothetical protein